jgi:hypothetical protein
MSNYGPYVSLDTRGQGQLFLATCQDCGAVVEIGGKDGTNLHDEWHARPTQETDPE